MTDTYGTRGGKHYGIDVAAPEGTNVVSIADGVVTRSYYSDTYGNVIFIEHLNGLETVYAHLHVRGAEEGQAVTEGESIGTVGNTGRSSGNHLHFEVHKGNWNIDKSESIDPFLVLSNEPEFMFASLGVDSPYGQDWKQRKSTFVMSPKILEDRTEIKVVDSEEMRKVKSLETIEVVVKSGDTLWSIASSYNMTVEQLKNLNDITDERINVDDKLVVEQTNIHIIQQGDTLTSIAAQYGQTAAEIMKQNQLDSDVIFPGEKIVIF